MPETEVAQGRASGELSKQELEYLHDTGLLRARFQIRETLAQQLVTAEQALKACIPHLSLSLPTQVLQQAGKLSRGENYRQLPYQVLDYPRYFGQGELFAFRCIVWWGHDISCVLLLQGDVAAKHREQLIARATELYGRQVWVGIHSTPWEHHFEADNLQPLDEFTEKQLRSHFSTHSFVKLVRRLPLAAYAQIPSFCAESFGIFLAANQ